MQRNISVLVICRSVRSSPQIQRLEAARVSYAFPWVGNWERLSWVV